MATRSSQTLSKRPPRKLTPERLTALILFLMGSCVAVVLANIPNHARSVVHGPMIPGHDNMACAHCHQPAAGTMRQQIQANVRFWLGLRQTPVPFGHEPVDPAPCVECHKRETDRHPAHRFREPRFAKVNQTLDARSCLSCHQEHQGVRVSAGGEFCQLCHGDLKPRHDPITPSHVQLVRDGQWSTCLTCHDFHGNHPVKAPVSFDDAHALAAVRNYLANGPDPYSQTKIHGAKKP